MKPGAILMLVIGLAGVFGFMAWAVVEMGGFGDLFSRSWVTNAIIGGGVLCVGALTWVLMRLAFVSARRGYDEPIRFAPAEEAEDRSGD
ncbi:MAG: hypothetical protein K1X35_10015 [Caulobacteraceae bacterium]|nr:hypothetical protein [Caulobacteraceae bacterium]